MCIGKVWFICMLRLGEGRIALIARLSGGQIESSLWCCHSARVATRTNKIRFSEYLLTKIVSRHTSAKLPSICPVYVLTPCTCTSSAPINAPAPILGNAIPATLRRAWEPIQFDVAFVFLMRVNAVMGSPGAKRIAAAHDRPAHAASHGHWLQCLPTRPLFKVLVRRRRCNRRPAHVTR